MFIDKSGDCCHRCCVCRGGKTIGQASSGRFGQIYHPDRPPVLLSQQHSPTVRRFSALVMLSSMDIVEIILFYRGNNSVGDRPVALCLQPLALGQALEARRTLRVRGLIRKHEYRILVSSYSDYHRPTTSRTTTVSKRACHLHRSCRTSGRIGKWRALRFDILGLCPIRTP